MVAFCAETTQTAAANGDTRTISLHHVHTNEELTITYKRNGRYDAEAMKKIDWIMRDWRKNESTKMDPEAIDILWTVQQQNAGKTISIICGYRSPGTNAMLRRRSSGVAEFSQHTLGKAIDFYIPGANLEQTREIGMKLQLGGVGYYPTSGSPFVHMDVGSVRHWPRMSHDQLARLFPDGRTVHIPSDGKPLKNYALALADIESRGTSMPSQLSLAQARGAGVGVDGKPKRSLLASIFGAKDKDEDEGETTATVRTRVAAVATDVKAKLESKKLASRPVEANPITKLIEEKVASAAPVPGSSEQIKPLKVAAIPMPPMRPAQIGKTIKATVVAAADVFTARGIWGNEGLKQVGHVESRGTWGDDGLKQIADMAAFKVADASAAGGAPMGYAAVLASTPRPDRPKHDKAKTPPEMIHPIQAMASIGADDVWTRALLLAPDLQNFMNTTLFGTPDPKELRPLMRKPNSALAITFGSDPTPGMTTSRFSGEAIAVLQSVSFVTRTAMLGE
jgi:uncharacterized protein YcbK (DUF882 family)